MKEYFEKQIANGKPVTIEQIEESIADAQDADFATEQWKANRRGKVGRILLFYALRGAIRKGNGVLSIEKVWCDELDTLSRDWVFESCNDSGLPIFRTPEYTPTMTEIHL
jgi:hypothetical protein